MLARFDSLFAASARARDASGAAISISGLPCNFLRDKHTAKFQPPAIGRITRRRDRKGECRLQLARRCCALADSTDSDIRPAPPGGSGRFASLRFGGIIMRRAEAISRRTMIYAQAWLFRRAPLLIFEIFLLRISTH